MSNVERLIEMVRQAAKRTLEFILLLLAVAVICMAVSFAGRAIFGNSVSDALQLGPSVRVLSLLCVQMLCALWLFAVIKRGNPLRTLFRVHLRTTAGLVIAAIASITLAASLVNVEAIRSNGFHPIKPTVHAGVWTSALMTMSLSALFEELFHRALLQPLLARLFANQIAGLLGAALIFTVMHPLENAVLVVPGALLLGTVFLRTRSVVCTTVLHLVMNVTVDLLKGNHLMVSPLLSAEEFAPMRPAIGLALLLLTIAFELLHRRTNRRAMQTPPRDIASAPVRPAIGSS